MAEIAVILDQFELDRTFFVQLALFGVLFAVLSPLYFQPFLRLFQARHQRTVADREAASQMMAQAEEKLEEHRRRIQAERLAARQEIEALIAEAKKQESEIMARARAEAKQIQADTQGSIEKNRAEIEGQLRSEIDVMARQLSEELLARKG